MTVANLLRTDCKLDQFVNGPRVYKPVIQFLNLVARFQFYKTTLAVPFRNQAERFENRSSDLRAVYK